VGQDVGVILIVGLLGTCPGPPGGPAFTALAAEQDSGLLCQRRRQVRRRVASSYCRGLDRLDTFGIIRASTTALVASITTKNRTPAALKPMLV